MDEERKPNLKLLYTLGMIASMAMLGLSLIGLLVLGGNQFIAGIIFFGFGFLYTTYRIFRILFKKPAKTLKTRTNQDKDDELESVSVSNDFH